MTMMDYSPPWSSEAPRGNGFHYSPNSHEITALLLNNNIYTGCHEYSFRLTLHISSKSNCRNNAVNEEVGNLLSKTLFSVF